MGKTNNTYERKSGSSVTAREQSYRLAKLLRAGCRELDRQLNTKKTKRVR